jgi:hypothetical protein
MELVGILISTNAVSTTPVDVSNKEDLIRKGVTFTDKNPIFVINLPNGGAIVRDVKLHSKNVLEVEIIFKTESSREFNPIRGTPTALPKHDFPAEKVDEIIIIIKKTTDGKPPQHVTLSIIACAEGTTTTTSSGIGFHSCLFFVNDSLT